MKTNIIRPPLGGALARSSKKNNPCPVCDNTSGKCRTTDTELVLCMNTLDAESTPTGWKFIGLTKGGGQWGRIVPSGQPESGNDQALRQQRAAERAAVEAARIARLKSKQHRHDEYKYLVANCPILEADRVDLIRRGLTDEDIERLTPINDGKRGYIIPIRDRDGLMVGGQRRLSNAVTGGKYRWATNGENHIPPTNELPLAHWQHSPHVRSIVLMDGTGVKPYLAAKRLNALAVGASGGSYTSSLKTFKATLDRFSDLPIVFTPDAGDIENHSVMNRLLATYKLIESFGREMRIAWWGQTSKDEHQDIDEITTETEIQVISWAEFVAIARTALQDKGKNAEFLAAPQLVEVPTKTSKKIPSKFESSIERGLVKSFFDKQVNLIAAKLSEGAKDRAIGRVAKRFALVQVALGLAHKYDLLPFPVEQIEWAISECFKAWLQERGGDGSIEIKNAVARIEHLLVTNEFSDRVFTLPNNGDRPVRNLLAYRNENFGGETEEFLVPTTVFDREFSDGVNKSELVKELQRLGMLAPPRSDGKSVRARRIKGKQSNFYVFPKRENSGDAGDAGDAGSYIPFQEPTPPASHLHHHPKIAGDAGDAVDELPTLLHHLHHHPKIAGDADTRRQDVDGESCLDAASPASPASPPKTDLGNFSKLKVGDRVRYIGALEKYKGIEGVVLADFGVSVDVKWDSGVVLGLVKTTEVEVAQ